MGGHTSWKKEPSGRLLQSVIDVIPEEIVLLDVDGTIRVVNLAWRDFADRNGLKSSDYCVGRNYFDLCESAEGLFSEDAHEVAAMLRDVAAGRRVDAEYAYTCHSPNEKRWYRMRAVRLSNVPLAMIVIHRRLDGDVMQHDVIRERFSQLTSREQQVLRLLVAGLSSKQVGQRLHISARTAENHRRSIMLKVNAANVADLVRLAIHGGVVPQFVSDVPPTGADSGRV